MYAPSLITYRSPGSTEWRAAVRQDSQIADVAALGFCGTARDLISTGPSALKDVIARSSEKTHVWREIPTDIIFGPPIPDPDKILCIGLNYREHARESGLEVPPVPVVFAKFRNSLIGPGAAIELPAISQQVDYEGELALVIGRRCKNVDASDALSVVAGYTALNDVSARDLQLQASQWTIGKAIDTFAPMGPGMVPAHLVPDPQKLELITQVNGQVVQKSSTADMIFGVAEIIAFLSRSMTLEPGDIIATGTPSGVGFKREPALFLKAGDVVEVEISSIGLLSNPVVRSVDVQLGMLSLFTFHRSLFTSYVLPTDLSDYQIPRLYLARSHGSRICD
jgi:2-keto-4-pentenoate hydratase/2-oxohepta-3-ene-1,7-dioic acid hydratase in catechol pathway